MKVLLTGDLHIHNHRSDMRRLEDGLDCLRWIYETGKIAGCKYVIVAGDFLHNRFSLNSYAYSKSCSIVAENKDIKTIFILGNHDLFYEDRYDVHSLMSLKEWTTVVEKPTQMKLGNYQVDLLPYTPTPSKYLESDVFANPSRVLISHLSIAEALLNAKYDIRSVEDDSKKKEVLTPDALSRWEKVWLGHYHYGQKVGKNIEYIGSPMQLTYGEAGQVKHVVIYDLATLKEKYVNNDMSPKFHIIDEESQLATIDASNSYVQMRCGNSLDSKFALRKQLSELGAREIEFAPVKTDVSKTNKALAKINLFFNDKNKLIEQYAKNVILPENIDADIAIKVGKSIVA